MSHNIQWPRSFRRTPCDWIMDLSIVIPAYNEELAIAGTLASAASVLSRRPWAHEIIVVDDGSTDSTAAVVVDHATRHSEVRIVRNELNRGKGFSVRRGVRESLGGVIGFVDADDKTDLGAIDIAMAHLAEGADLVIGDRTLAGSDIAVARPRYRQWGSDQFRRLVRCCMGLGEYPDTQCGFKFLQRSVAIDLFSRQRVDGYMFDVELLLLARRQGYRVAPIPVCWRDDADSRFNPVAGTLRNLCELARIRWVCR